MRIKKIEDLKNYLQELLEALENIDDEKELEIYTSTYGLYGMLLSIPSVGYIDLDELKEEGE